MTYTLQIYNFLLHWFRLNRNLCLPCPYSQVAEAFSHWAGHLSPRPIDTSSPRGWADVGDEVYNRPCPELWFPCLSRTSCRSSRKIYLVTLTTITSTFIQVVYKQPSKLSFFFSPIYRYHDNKILKWLRRDFRKDKDGDPFERKGDFLLRRKTIVTLSVEILFHSRGAWHLLYRGWWKLNYTY